MNKNIMHKIIFGAATAVAAMTFTTEASALPVFARQTGMECSACHFQHFPMLNSFGRAFKAGGFTMIGAQGKVEGDRLSIPNTLNMAVLTTAGYAKSNGKTAVPGGFNDINKGAVYVPGTNGEFSLFLGGRVSENAGFLAEIGSIGATALSSAKMPILYEVADGTRAGVVFFTTGGQGASYGFETLNTGANAVHQMSGTPGFDSSHTNSISAQQYIGTGTAATGAAIVVNNSMGFVNVTKFHMAGPADLGGTGAPLGSTYLRLAGTMDVGAWELGAGAQNWSGASSTTVGAVAPSPLAVNVGTHASAVDFQLQGEAGKMPVGVYVTWAVAPAMANPTATGVNGNAFNAGTMTRRAVNLAGEVGVIPNVATLAMAYRNGKSGTSVTAGTNETDNAITLIGTYKVAQNMLASLSYTKQSGTYWNTTGTGGAAAAAGAAGNSTYTINLFTLF